MSLSVWSSLFVREVAGEGDTRKWNGVRSYQDIPDLWSPISPGFPIFPRLISKNFLNEMSLFFFYIGEQLANFVKIPTFPGQREKHDRVGICLYFALDIILSPVLTSKSLAGLWRVLRVKTNKPPAGAG